MDARTRRTKLIDRDVQHRDAWLCVIATEGAETEPRYLHELQERGVVNRSRVKLIPLPTSSGQEGPGDGSDPAHVLARLVDYEERHRLTEYDQRWLVLDVDHHHTGAHRSNLQQVLDEARQRGYRVALSAPCFEVWLLLHFADQDPASFPARPRELKALLARVRDQLGRTYPAALCERAAIERAVTRAQGLDPTPESPWPPAPGTKVYHLLTALPRA